jgi:hypothetical protein
MSACFQVAHRIGLVVGALPSMQNSGCLRVFLFVFVFPLACKLFGCAVLDGAGSGGVVAGFVVVRSSIRTSSVGASCRLVDGPTSAGEGRPRSTPSRNYPAC